MITPDEIYLDGSVRISEYDWLCIRMDLNYLYFRIDNGLDETEIPDDYKLMYDCNE